MSGTLPPLSYYGIRQIEPPLTEAQLAPPDPSLKIVQFCAPLTPAELRRLAAFLREYPSLKFRVYAHGLHAPVDDLEFLRDFSFLRNFAVDVRTLPSFDGLRHLSPANLTHLTLGATKTQRISLSVLRSFTGLQRLWIYGHAKGFETLASLTALRSLWMHSVTVPTLRPLAELPALEALMISLGGTTEIGELANVKRLSYLDLAWIRGMRDVSVLGRIPRLRDLRLSKMQHVTELPSFRDSAELRYVELEQMHAVHDLGPIAEAPGLRQVAVYGCRGLEPEAFAPFVGHPALEAVVAGLRTTRAGAAVYAMLPHVRRETMWKHPSLSW